MVQIGILMTTSPGCGQQSRWSAEWLSDSIRCIQISHLPGWLPCDPRGKLRAVHLQLVSGIKTKYLTVVWGKSWYLLCWWSWVPVSLVKLSVWQPAPHLSTGPDQISQIDLMVEIWNCLTWSVSHVGKTENLKEQLKERRSFVFLLLLFHNAQQLSSQNMKIRTCRVNISGHAQWVPWN